jgi:hypothetical protein
MAFTRKITGEGDLPRILRAAEKQFLKNILLGFKSL